MFTIDRMTLAATLIVSLLIQNSYAVDVKKLVFHSSRNENPDIYVAQGIRQDVTRLTRHIAVDMAPTWSPDGKHIAFVSNRGNKRSHIWAIDANGKNLTQLTNGFHDDEPDWSPDGTTIAYHSQRKETKDYPFQIPLTEVYLMNADGSNQRQLVGEDSMQPCWSPGGTRIVFMYAKNLDFLPQIHVINPDGTGLRKLTHNDGVLENPTWSPDGNSIAYEQGWHLWVMDSNGGNKRQLTSKNAKKTIDSDPTWSPDSKHIIFNSTRDGPESNLFIISVDSGFVNDVFPPNRHIENQADWFHPGPLSVSPVDTKVTIWGRLKSGQW